MGSAQADGRLLERQHLLVRRFGMRVDESASSVGKLLPFALTGHVGARLRRDDPQKPGFGIPSRGHPDRDAALRDVAAEPSLHRGHSG
jgi:hypothetical protein